MRGKWWRLEAITPTGLTDSMGLFQGKTWWLEHKVGRPTLDVLRPKQLEFAHECIERGVPFWLCFGHRGSAVFFEGLTLTRPAVPAFWIAR